MATKRLIDPIKLIEEITGMKKVDPYNKRRGLIERWVRNEGYDILTLLVKHFPTVDAVEVVRCKDCKNRDDITGECKHPKAVGWDVIIPEDNDFCSYGERKDNG